MRKRTIALLFYLLAGATLIAQDQVAFAEEIEQHRHHYKEDFLKDERSPLQEEDLPYLNFYPAKEAYKIQAAFTRTPDAKPFDLATYSGITKPYVQYGTLTLPFQDSVISLAVYQSLRLAKLPMYKDYFFIPFKDLTNGEDTYGGGRYMDVKISDIEEQTLTIDFNKAYNPWCAFSDGYNCPIPPVANHLEVAIEAGEMNFGKEKKKK